MTTPARQSVWMAVILAATTGIGAAQQVIPGVVTSQLLQTSQFRVALTYEAALARLAQYYEVQVGRKLAVAFPEIAPRQHYDVWHDMWVGFGLDDTQLTVTMKRPSDSITNRLVKHWMLEFAGRLGAPIPIQYRELPAVAISEADIYALPKDLPAIFKSLPGMKTLPSWQHLGLAVSADPMFSVTMEKAGLHGVHRVILTAENATGLRQLNAAMSLGLQRPCICGVYSELAEVEQDVSAEVQAKTAILGTYTVGTIFAPESTRKHEEDAVRAKPEMKKRITEATGNYNIKYRPDKPYNRASITVFQLKDYVRETGESHGETVAGRLAIAGVRLPIGSAPPLNARIKLEGVVPGAYRIRLEGDGPAGQPVRIDERIFWFDGKVFEEI